MKRTIYVSVSLLYCLLFHSTVFAQQSRNNNKSSNPYRGQYQRIITGSNSHFTFEIRNGFLWASGYNSSGQLGDGTRVNRSVPVQIGTDNKWVNIAPGAFHTIALKSDGTLWAWGYNAQGQLGDGTIEDRYNPIQVGSDTKWTSIAAAEKHSIGLKSDGTLWAWGANDKGQIGDGTDEDRNVPIQVGTDAKWIDIAAGAYQNIALKSDGTLWGWGDNEYGQLGDGTDTERNVPTKIGTDTKWSHITAGLFYSAALKSDGTIWAWGFNAQGQLGDGTTIDSDSPIRIGTDNNWTSIAAGGFHTVALKSDGTLWEWGWNGNGQLGDGTTIKKDAPIRIGTDNNWVNIAPGNKHTIALKSDGTIWAWGYNSMGQLGDGTTSMKNSPSNSQAALNAWITEANGYAHSLAIKGDGTLWAWGNNQFGQLGDSTSTNRAMAVQIGTGNNWVSVAGGQSTSLGLQSDGTLWGWGVKGHGEIGDGTIIGKSIPVRIGTDINWTSIASGDYHSLALKSDGTIWAWGINTNGEIGDGTSINRDAPVKIGNDNNWTSIAAGDDHSLALKSDGTLWAWGDNFYGELGDGTDKDKKVPTMIGSDTTWTSIAAGSSHSIALKSDGTLWIWGYNFTGQIGDNTNTSRYIPTKITTDSTWISIAGGSEHTLALKNNGQLWTWGGNGYGQLGDGTLFNKYIPTEITGQKNVVSIGKGSMTFHSAIIKVDRNSICLAGTNHFGELGDGTNEHSDVFKCDNSVCASLQLAMENTVVENMAISGPGNRTDFQLGCTLVSSLTPSGANPVSGSAINKVFIDNTVQKLNGQPYVQRHYDIEPSTDASTATAEITLYYTQEEFNAYNAGRGEFLSVPTDGADIENYKANIRITQYHGIPSGGNNPVNYKGGSTLIKPTSVVWDERNNWWAVNFPVTGFSGFFLHSNTGGILDVSLMRFSAKRTSGIANRLDWSTATEDANTNFDITRSDNGVSFKTLSGMNGKGNNSDYTYYDEQPLSGTNYYRLKISSGNNKVAYSNIAIVRNRGGNVTIAPVPARNTVTIRNSDASLNGRMGIVSDMQGREVLRFTMAAIKILDISTLTSGVYSLRLPSGEVMRLVKQ